MRNRPLIIILLCNALLLAGFINVCYQASKMRNDFIEEETPYNEYELQFLKSQGVTFDSTEDIPQIYVRKTEGLKKD